MQAVRRQFDRPNWRGEPEAVEPVAKLRTQSQCGGSQPGREFEQASLRARKIAWRLVVLEIDPLTQNA